mgnify:FL=1
MMERLTTTAERDVNSLRALEAEKSGHCGSLYVDYLLLAEN